MSPPPPHSDEAQRPAQLVCPFAVAGAHGGRRARRLRAGRAGAGTARGSASTRRSRQPNWPKRSTSSMRWWPDIS